MYASAVAVSAPVALVGGLKALPKPSKVQALKKVAACRVAPRKVVVAAAKRNNAVAAAPAAAASLLVASQANAAEILAAQPQEIAEVAGITPVFYVVFLVASLGFTLATFIVLNKIKLI
eukprot:CAMPEP_0118956638 /NCGR_PEP_ID=MMETSP1169-20130426/61685_1 /TAXON_ID=36882 /ORGANISM="Pyramimonas obovata, Strain CCMP722" /LENGTH=118 /DNA_ID=CAMNT_0006904677 /DNA_START=94 /DNA_END=450 /DNA_ORIENTATION=+